jgi:hypothetical protein
MGKKLEIRVITLLGVIFGSMIAGGFALSIIQQVGG